MTKSNLDDFYEQSGDIFKLCIVASRRARQINKLRMNKYPMPNEDQEEIVNVEKEEVDWDSMEKPTTLAINEVREGRADYEMRTSEDEE